MRRLAGSLRLRLLAGTLFWIAASLLIAGWSLSSLFHQHVTAQFHAELQNHLDQLTANLALDADGRPTLALPLSDPRLSRPYSGLYWQVDELVAAPGTNQAPAAGLLRSRSLWDQVLAVPADSPDDGEVHQHRLAGPVGTMLGMVERSVRLEQAGAAPTRALRLIVAADERLLAEPVARFNGALWLALGVLGAGLACAALVQVSVGLAPLEKLRRALGRVRDGTAPGLEGEFPGEVMPLVEEFNAVLGHRAEVVKRARTRAGNLAHALKTPLTVLANAAAEREQGSDEDRQFARLVRAQVATANRQVQYHLASAQAAATQRVPGARTPLRPVLEGLLRTMRRIHAERGLELRLSKFAEELAFRGDEHDLQEMLGNLIDNACKWAAGEVTIDAHRDGEALLIRIDDDGHGIAADQRAAVLRRGVRADTEVPGSGLGLAIVGELVELNGGTLELADSPLGGLRVVIKLPAARQGQ